MEYAEVGRCLSTAGATAQFTPHCNLLYYKNIRKTVSVEISYNVCNT